MEREAMNDDKVVARQLGRTPRGAFSVSVRCSYGYPQVIRVHPVVEGKPFPTLYWLTCPFLSREIGHLEAAGWVKQLEARMVEEPELRSAMHEAHQRTWSQRDQLLSSEEKAALAADGTLVGLEGRGIGGISDWDRLKCLHLHAAHALADENPT
ncbi:DUF501 domain-containing protein, partial [Candidatus Bipolaricaulota bacterium]|nr:DUF501 domain-containing protein [Candidatus Bipolaricaulota bacterium]